MTDRRWKMQNQLYRMKARKSELERFILNTTKHYMFLRVYDPFRRRPNESFKSYILSVLHLFIFGLDILLGYYYNKYIAFLKLKKSKKEILTLTKEIKLYEQYKLWRR